jgi:hypothetical protein
VVVVEYLGSPCATVLSWEETIFLSIPRKKPLPENVNLPCVESLLCVGIGNFKHIKQEEREEQLLRKNQEPVDPFIPGLVPISLSVSIPKKKLYSVELGTYPTMIQPGISQLVVALKQPHNTWYMKHLVD